MRGPLNRGHLKIPMITIIRVGLGSIYSISTWFGVWVSMSLRSSGPKTHAGPSLLLRKRFGSDRFDNVSVSIWTPPLVIEAQPEWNWRSACRTLDYPKCCPNPLIKQLQKFLPMFFTLGVVVRFRAVFAGNITLRPFGQQLLMFFCSWDGKKLGAHVVIVFWVVTPRECIWETHFASVQPALFGDGSAACILFRISKSELLLLFLFLRLLWFLYIIIIIIIIIYICYLWVYLSPFWWWKRSLHNFQNFEKRSEGP